MGKPATIDAGPSTELEPIPREASRQLSQTIIELPALFAADSDHLDRFVGGFAGHRPALMALGGRLLIWLTVCGDTGSRSLARVEVAQTEAILTSDARDERGRTVVDISVAAPGLLIDLKDVPAWAGSSFAELLRQQAAMQRPRHRRMRFPRQQKFPA